MILTIDVGNTNIVIGVWEENTIKCSARTKTDREKTPDAYAVEFKNILELYDIPVLSINGTIISSVVPQITYALETAVKKLTGRVPMLLDHRLKTGLNLKIDNPQSLGSDLIADAVGAVSKYPKPIIFVDLGTATKICVIDEDGNFLGGAIMSGVRIGIDALSERAAKLPQIELKPPQKMIGTNTIDSMKSGAVYGTASMIDGMVARFEASLGKKTTVVATGGYSSEIIPFCDCGAIYDSDLLLDGLKVIYEMNKNN